MTEQKKFVADSEEGRNFAYELTQKLTYFVVTTELVFCGYVLLNADKLVHFTVAAYLFGASGLAAAVGLLWRFCYNITYHAHAHAQQSIRTGYFETRAYKVARFVQGYLHNSYVVLSVSTFFCILGYGFVYILNYADLQRQHVMAIQAEQRIKLSSSSPKMMPVKVQPTKIHSNTGNP